MHDVIITVFASVVFVNAMFVNSIFVNDEEAVDHAFGDVVAAGTFLHSGTGVASLASR